MKILSLFAGAGGLDLGFKQANFEIIWANEYDKKIWQTFQANFPNTHLDKRSITHILSNEMPDNIDGVVGGPPCQSWSEAGARRGIDDERGQLFFEYIRILEDKQPKFFLAENVQGMLFKRNQVALKQIMTSFQEAGYHVTYKLLNTANYDVPQDRKRVIFIGFRNDLNINFKFPSPSHQLLTLKEAIWDLRHNAMPATGKNHTNGVNTKIPNHEYMTGGFSSMFMSRNRVRKWDEQSFTIQAGGRHAPIHPQASVMIKIGKDEFAFDKNSPHPYRRLTVREAARVQTFPDDFIFYYDRIADGYKMVGNAVPVTFAKHIANTIKYYLENKDKLKTSEPVKIPTQLELLS
jgi:DNA (cytosine-5)-methyltransferase 1